MINELTLQEIIRATYIEPMEFRNFRFDTRMSDRGPQVSMSVDVVCIDTDKTIPIKCEWAHIEPGTDESDTVRRFLDMATKTLIHELQEHFYYMGTKLFGPHTNVKDLIQAAQHG